MGTCRQCGLWSVAEHALVQVSTTRALTCPETVHQRPCMMTEIETWLSDSRISNNSVADHRKRRPVLSPLRNCVDRCHVWPYWVSRCKPWRWMLTDISIHKPVTGMCCLAMSDLVYQLFNDSSKTGHITRAVAMIHQSLVANSHHNDKHDKTLLPVSHPL